MVLKTVLQSPALISTLTSAPPTLARPLFTISLEPIGGTSSCTFGSIPSQYAQFGNSIVYTPTVANIPAWAVKVTSCSFNNQVCGSAFDAYIDTASEDLQLPKDIVDLYFQQLGDNTKFIDSGEIYVYKCNTMLPDLSISIGQYLTTISGAYLAGSKYENAQDCTYKHSYSSFLLVYS